MFAIVIGFTVLGGDAVQAQTHHSYRHHPHYYAHKQTSHRKKDALIGGGAGAVTGALISKHPVKGAVIGGAVGAGVGYLHGKKKDKGR